MQVFPKNVVLKAAFSFLDKGFFFFKTGENDALLLQLTIRETAKETPQELIENFSDTLLETYLRDILEKENKIIRETIVEKAINGPLDQNNFVTFDSENMNQNNSNNLNQQKNEIDFNKDIDDILKEIENDPDLKIDQAEIEKILKEIEEESALEKPKVTVDMSGLKKAKDQFKK